MRLKRLIAWTIYEERQKRGLSQERLGKMAGCHRTTVAKIEAEELQSMDLIEAVLDALDVNEFAQLVKDKSPVRATKQVPADKLPKEEPKPRQNGNRSLRGASGMTCKDCRHGYSGEDAAPGPNRRACKRFEPRDV